MIIEGAGHTDPAAWPTGPDEAQDPAAFLRRIQTGAPPPSAAQPREVPTEAKKERAQQEMQRGQLARGCRTLIETGLANDDGRAQLLDRHPGARLPTTEAHPANAWAAPSEEDTDRYLTVEKLLQAARRSKRGGAADSLGIRISEDFLDLLLHGSTDAKEAFRTYVCKPYYTGAQPRGSPPPEILHGGTLLALSKSPKPGVRPIVIGSAIRRLTVRAALDGLTPALDAYFTKSHERVIQLAGGAPDGATRAFKLLEQVLEQKVQDDPRPPEEKLANPWAVLCCDRTNAFNRVARSPALDNLAGVASRDYDFGPDGIARIPKGNDGRHSCRSRRSPAMGRRRTTTSPLSGS